MKRLFKNSALFLLPIIIILVVLPINVRQQYEGLKGDCANHAIWVHDRIIDNETPIDIAFIGSSHTMNAINDQLISEKISSINSVNFGYCRFGRNLHYLIIKRLIKHKKIKHAIFEVREKEDLSSHPIFPYLASSNETFFPSIFINKKYFSDCWNHLAYKVELTQDILFKTYNSPPTNSHLYGNIAIEEPADLEFLKKIKIKRQKPSYKPLEIERTINNKYPFSYLKKSIQLCKENNITVSFIYLPSYASQYKEPTEIEFYSKWGNVLIPPTTILKPPQNWGDENHLNTKGSLDISEWLIKELSKNND